MNGSPAVTTGRHSSIKLIDAVKEGIFIPIGVVPRKIRLSSLTEMSDDEGLFIFLKKKPPLQAG